MKALRYNTGALEYEAAYGKFKISIDPNLLKRVQTAMQDQRKNNGKNKRTGKCRNRFNRIKLALKKRG